MLRYRKIIKDNQKEISFLRKEIGRLEGKMDGIKTKLYKDVEIFSAAGLRFSIQESRHLELLNEAKGKGYFRHNMCFQPIGAKEDWGFFTHKYSDISDNYRYSKENNSLWIPAIGVRGNFSCHLVCIYESGKWANIEKINK